MYYVFFRNSFGDWPANLRGLYAESKFIFNANTIISVLIIYIFGLLIFCEAEGRALLLICLL